MNRQIYYSLAKLAPILALVFGMVSAHAEGQQSRLVKWKVGVLISGPVLAGQTEYFPRALKSGEIVELTFTIDPSAPVINDEAPFTYGYSLSAIKAVEINATDWEVKYKYASGSLSVTNDDADFGDTLSLAVTSTTGDYILAHPGKTWYNAEVDLRNPGAWPAGTGPWQPFTSVSIPKFPPDLGFFPSHYAYIEARRDLPGSNQIDGNTYYGQVLWITAKKCEFSRD